MPLADKNGEIGRRAGVADLIRFFQILPKKLVEKILTMSDFVDRLLIGRQQSVDGIMEQIKSIDFLHWFVFGPMLATFIKALFSKLSLDQFYKFNFIKKDLLKLFCKNQE